MHDFWMLKNSQIRLSKEQKVLEDKGYQAIQDLHNNSRMPHKKRRGKT
jgi:hypothetical protein